MLGSRINFMFSRATHSKICLIGGGSAGLNISSHLLKHFSGSDMRIFEPSLIHYYQPGYTMIGADIASSRVATRPNKDVLNRDIPWTTDYVTKIEADKSLLHTQKGETYSYDHLLILAGIQLDWDKIKGAKEAVEDPNCPASTIYSLNGAEKMRKLGRQFKGGRAIFTQPQMPIKCGGAPQKILYLLTHQWQKKGIKADVQFNKTIEVMFGVPKYSAALTKIAQGYGIDTRFKRKLVEIRKDERIAVFQKDGKLEEEKFDLLHFVPPMKAPAFIAESGLADSKGYVDVDKGTMRHTKYSNIWACGDNSSLPCSKTAAAIFSQTDVLVDNLKNLILKGEEPKKIYDGYSSCPIFVGGNQLLLAEFKYNNVLAETFFKDQERPRIPFYYLKKDFFPWTYWNMVPRGIWAGKDGLKTW